MLASRRSLLVLIDLQTRLYPAMTPSPPNLLARIQILVRAARALDIPMRVTRQYPQGLGPVLPEIAAILPEPVPTFDKTTFSCCADRALDESLKGDRDQLVLAGIETHVCVLQTALDLKARGDDVSVITDACASRSPDDHGQALTRMSREGVRLVSTESAVFEWLRDAAHPRFRELAREIRGLQKTEPGS